MTRPKDISIRAHRDMMRQAHRVQGLYWHTNHLPRHFEQRAVNRYGYQRRKAATLKRKERLAAKGKVLMGGKVYLVWTGRTMQNLRDFVGIREFPSRVTVRMVGPDYLRINYTGNRPNLKREITATTADERRELAGVLRDEIKKRRDAYRKQRETKNL